MGNQFAPQGQVFVCAACGKWSRDKYGEQTHGWDVSCVVNSVLVYEDSIVVKDGRVVSAKAVAEGETE